MTNLNNDKLEDKAIVTQDTINEYSPYKLQIFFAQPDGKYKLIVETTKLIEAQFPNGREDYREETGFNEITILKGILTVKIQLLRGNFEHKFKFQNGNFELIGFTQVNSEGLEIYTIDFNLSTGKRTVKTERYDEDNVISKTEEKIKIRPLPKIQDIVPFENDLY